MGKLAIIVNGRPGAGKDTLCDAVIRRGRARKVSSIDPIAALARQIGWDGVKDGRSRKLLSDLKRVCADFNDLPNQYVLRAHADFLRSGDDVLFVHIREGDQISAFRRAAAGDCVTLLVRRPGPEEPVGNASDDNVDGTVYDAVYHNDKPLEEMEDDFCAFVAGLLKERDTGR